VNEPHQAGVCCKLPEEEQSSKNRKDAGNFQGCPFNILRRGKPPDAEAEAGAGKVISDAKGRKNMARLWASRRTCHPLADRHIRQGKQEFIAIHTEKPDRQQAGKRIGRVKPHA
jgi:hypothetical protein